MSLRLTVFEGSYFFRLKEPEINNSRSEASKDGVQNSDFSLYPLLSGRLRTRLKRLNGVRKIYV
ncbi:hypothetical protein NXV57_25390 [Bacteroides thetaiotaomicron]|nr:hypothetical protein [Bacteroides thetaiotaomicron]